MKLPAAKLIPILFFFQLHNPSEHGKDAVEGTLGVIKLDRVVKEILYRWFSEF